MLITSPSARNHDSLSPAFHRRHDLRLLFFGGLRHYAEEHAARDGALRRVLLRDVPTRDIRGWLGYGIASPFGDALTQRRCEFSNLPTRTRRRSSSSGTPIACIAPLHGCSLG